jgi:hypothetical protein
MPIQAVGHSWRRDKALTVPTPIVFLPFFLPLQVESVTGGSPLTNQFFLAAPRGAPYGADHDLGRLHPHVIASIRTQSPIPNLYLTGTLTHFARI